ncbi:ABC transporter ATP-binding protein [Paenibacillus xanthanilyticus]|uniref:ABC transporter ATP-binding protein n=1 Tax=Paenibacillus xanthanilyticus TaxID=1783531 RepID=A0ABV8KE64_9BACL
MGKLLSYIKPYRVPSAIALVLMLVELFVELYHPLLLAKIIDEGVAARDLHTVAVWGSVMIGLALLGFGCGIVNTFYASKASQGFSYDARQALFEKIQSFSFSTFDRFPTETLLTRMTSDMNQIQMAIFLGLRVYMRSPLLIIGSLALAVMINARLALALAIATPLVLGCLYLTLKKGMRLFEHAQRKLDRMNGVIREALMGIRLIRVFVRSERERARFDDANGELAASTTAALRLVEFVLPLLLLAMNLCLLSILWLGGAQMSVGGMTMGEVVAVVNYAARITAAFSPISMMINNLARARAATGRIAEVLEARPDVVEAGDADDALRITAGRIEFDRVSFAYAGSSGHALRDVSFRARAGETIAIMGATGSGKSTLLQLIPRLYDAGEGRIRIDGIEIKRLRFGHLRGAIGYAPQEVQLFSGTVLDNLRFGKEDASEADVVEAAKLAQIHETIAKMESGYDTALGERGVNLSGGQKQRLSLARALLRKPKLLLLDDCTSALDAVTERKVLDVLRALPCTTLFITQKVGAAREADRILLLADGRIQGFGTHAELLAASSAYRRIADSQASGEAAAHA